MSDYSNDDGAPLPPRKGLHAKPEDLGSLVTDSVRSLIGLVKVSWTEK